MVTRSFTVTRIIAMVADTVSAEVSNVEVEVPRTYKDEQKLIKVAKQMIETETVKFVTIVDKEEVSKLYGMTEIDFLKYAVELDKDTRKMLETDEAEADDEAGTDEE